MQSALIMVESLWAMMKEVLSAMSLSMACWRYLSVLVSMELVASSRIRNGASFNIALATAICCFCPAENERSLLM